MRPETTPQRGWSRNLRVRFALVFALSLLPIGLIALLQGIASLEAARARALSDVAADTYRAAGAVLNAVQSAQGIASTLAQNVPLIEDDARTCSAFMIRVQTSLPDLSFVGYVPGTGQLTCSSADGPLDLSGNATFQRINGDPEPHFYASPDARISRQSVMGVTYPVRNAEGQIDGYTAVSIPHSALAPTGGRTSAADPLTLLTFDSMGMVLTASNGLETLDPDLPADRTLEALVGQIERAFFTEANSGAERLYSVVPLVRGELYALGVWAPERIGAGKGLAAVARVLALPVAMWFASLVVAWFSVEQIVSRHILALKASITSFASGSRIVGELNFDNAPAELQEVLEAYRTMTFTILRDEAEMENIVHQKEVLLREVHHRVKNNLQLIASIINLQMRKEERPEIKSVMKGLQDRVMTLATVHRELYQTTGTVEVQARELLGDIVRQIITMSTGDYRRFHVATDFDDIVMTPDQAVPLSLLLTEALNNAMKYAGAAEGQVPGLTVSLRRIGAARAELMVEYSVAPGGDQGSRTPLTERTGLGSQLLQAFAHQVGGELVQEATDTTHRVSVPFTLRAVDLGDEGRIATPAENGNQACP